MPKGTVKWFNETKGFGFIVPDEGGKDIFVHISAVQREGQRVLRDGEAVSYEVTESAKGLQASNVVPE